MKPIYFLALIPVSLWAQAGGDAYRGAAVLQREKCIQCHSVRGQGGSSAPDLGIRTSRQYTPAVMTSVMWNHAPAMWSAMAGRGVARPELTVKEADDLFAYFYSLRYFDKPGEAERGKRLFAAKHCAECHSVAGEGKGPGKPLQQWGGMTDPVVLVEQMWNHSSLMKRAIEAKNLAWVSLTGQDLTDLAVYVQNLPAMRNKATTFWLPGPQGGEALFREKGCAVCHTGAQAIQSGGGAATLTEIAAALWNHAPRIADQPAISTDEMRQIVSYVWEKQSVGAAGDAQRGRQAFAKKSCESCHSSAGGAPDLERGVKSYSPSAMVAALWKHGPAMLEQMRQKNVPWPRLNPADVSDLVAFLNTKP